MSGSTPYFQFGAQRRYPYAWHGGAGGVPQSRLAAESRELGIFDLLESSPPGAMPYQALRQTRLHNPTATGDLSDNQKALAVVAAAALAAWWVMRRRPSGPRRNPARARYEVYAAPRGGRGLAYAMSFTRKQDAEAYAASLRRDGRRASVRRRR